MPGSKSYSAYVAAGRFISPFAITLLRFHGRVTRTKRSRVVVRNEHGEVLLLRSWIGQNRWELPGGGVMRGEDPRAAAQRELLEETGVDMPLTAFIYLATFQVGYEALVYQLTVAKSQLPHKQHNAKEIVALRWYKVAAVPTDTSELVLQVLKIMSKTDEI